jgi:hypothetical protein
MLICLAIPGNIFPVVEKSTDVDGFLGRPMRSCHQSNVLVLTTKDGLLVTEELPWRLLI